MHMRKTILLAATMLLTSCGGGGGGETACSSDYWDGTVGTCLPEGWAVISAETLLARGVPEETVVAFQREAAVSGQFPTVAVTEEALAQPTDPARYSEANIRAVEVLEAYEHVDTESFMVDDVDVQLHTFTGQPIEGEPKRRFYQVSTTMGDTGYTFTAVTPVSIDSALEEEIMLMLRNMTFVAPVEEE